MKRPLITANQVTVVRLLPMPLMAYFIYRSFPFGTSNFNAGMLWMTIILGTLIGCTDFVDGYLARKHGPTVFGSLLDPIADKIFIAFVYAPLADIGIVPLWLCGLMFVREFLVTALRSLYEHRGLSLKTSYFAKAKTWVQMQSIGVIPLLPLLGERGTWILTILGIALPLVAAAIWWLVKKTVWSGAFIMTGCFALFAVVFPFTDLQGGMAAIMVGVVVVTWLSAIDYFIGGFRQLRGRGDLASADVIRLIAGMLIPTLVFVVLARTSVIWALLAILAAEFAASGLDNLLSHHKQASSAKVWGARTLGVCALLFLAACVPQHGMGSAALTASAALVSVVGTALEYWRSRHIYLDAKIRASIPRVSIDD